MSVVPGISAFILLVCPVFAGDVTVHVHITRKLTKKTVVVPVYDLRGAVPSFSQASPVDSEFDRTIIMLSGKIPIPAEPQTVTIEQRNSQFEPDLVVVPEGSTVRFPNADPIFHNVFSLSHAKEFDLGYYPKGQSKPVKFLRAGVVQVYCHIHPKMYAAIVVTDSPWYGKPAADGTIVWKDVPAGKYRASAWHKVAGMYQASVDVPAQGGVEVDIYVPILDAERKP